MKKQLLLLVLMLLPMIAFADKSGTCGDNLTWTLNESTGVLTIEGSGAMKDYDSRSSVTFVPWYGVRSGISTECTAEPYCALGIVGHDARKRDGNGEKLTR